MCHCIFLKLLHGYIIRIDLVPIFPLSRVHDAWARRTQWVRQGSRAIACHEPGVHLASSIRDSRTTRLTNDRSRLTNWWALHLNPSSRVTTCQAWTMTPLLCLSNAKACVGRDAGKCIVITGRRVTFYLVVSLLACTYGYAKSYKKHM